MQQLALRPAWFPQPCVVCGEPLTLSRGHWNRQPAHPGKCEAERRARKKKRPCEWCGQMFMPGRDQPKKFCSRPCYYKSVNQRPMFVTGKCQHCGGSFKRSAAAIKRTKRSFCSPACRALGTRGAKNVLYRGGNDPNRGGEWRRIAESIRQREGYVCKRCSKSQEENGEKLAVDHIRPWRSFEDKAAANDPGNLVALCKSCHSHKTFRVESAWLRGDALALKSWLVSLGMEQW